jgi:hypothetical protein
VICRPAAGAGANHELAFADPYQIRLRGKLFASLSRLHIAFGETIVMDSVILNLHMSIITH